MSKIVEYIAHPPCHPASWRPHQLTLRVLTLLVVLLGAIYVYPSWIWPVVGIVIAIALATHPVCAITGRDHAPGRHWFGLVDNPARRRPWKRDRARV